MPSPRPFAVALGLLAACGEPTPPAPVVELTPGADTVSTGYAEVVDGQWLGGERWAVVAPLDVTVGIVDLGRRDVVPLGGEGTREIRNPSILFLVGRYTARGRLGPAPGEPVDQGRQARPRRAGPRAAPGRASARPGTRAAAGTPNSSRRREGTAAAIAIPRRSSAASPKFERLDTVARLAPLDLAEVMGDAGRRFEQRALSGEDHWGVTARRMGMGGSGLRESGGLALPHGRVGARATRYRTGCSR